MVIGRGGTSKLFLTGLFSLFNFIYFNFVAPGKRFQLCLRSVGRKISNHKGVHFR